jgi:Ca2+-binding EF-hand superfamily protein
MLSDFQRAKLERRFELLDMDGDGYITANDYDVASASVCRAFDFAKDSAQYEKVHVLYLRLWVALSRRMDEQQSGMISRRQFIESCERVIVEAEQGYDRIIGPIALTIFDLIDADDSGTLDIEELTTWFNAYGVCADDAARAFRAVDRNGDGLLDADEVQKAIREFYTSDDPQAPGNLIFGPLPIQAAAKNGNGHGGGNGDVQAASMRAAAQKHPSKKKPATISAKR